MSFRSTPAQRLGCTATTSANDSVFEALIAPHRSLSRNGYLIVTGLMLVLSVSVAVRFWLLGAWPVVAFSFIDAPLFILLLAINRRQARASELIMLNTHHLTIIRTDPSGRQKQVSIPSTWLRVDLDAGHGIPRLMLSSHGRGCEIGAFLHDPDKLLLFEALSDAVHRLKNPRFDNLQLQDS